MDIDSYVVYSSKKAAQDFWLACELAPVQVDRIQGHYISEEIASANLEMAILYYQTYREITS